MTTWPLDITQLYAPGDELHERLWRLSTQLDAIDVQLREARMFTERKENHRDGRDPW